MANTNDNPKLGINLPVLDPALKKIQAALEAQMELMVYGGRGHSKTLTYKDIEESTKAIIAKYGEPTIRWNHDPSKHIGIAGLTMNEYRKAAGLPLIGELDHSIGFKYIGGIDLAKPDGDIQAFIKCDDRNFIESTQRHDDKEFNEWQEYLLKLTCAQFNISPALLNNVTEQKIDNMASVAIIINKNSEFRRIEEYLLLGGAYWNGKTHMQRYNLGRDLHFAPNRTELGNPAPSHYYVTINSQDKQMNLYEGRPAAEQNIRRAGYLLINIEKAKQLIKVSRTPQQYLGILMHGGSDSISAGDVDINGLFGISGRQTDADIWAQHHDSMNDERIKQKAGTKEYINMFSIADIVNTTTKTTTTKLLKLMGKQNVKSSGGIKVQSSVKMKSNK